MRGERDLSQSHKTWSRAICKCGEVEDRRADGDFSGAEPCESCGTVPKVYVYPDPHGAPREPRTWRCSRCNELLAASPLAEPFCGQCAPREEPRAPDGNLVATLFKALRRQNDWHLQRTKPDPEYGFIPAHEYGDSSMWEETSKALHAAEVWIGGDAPPPASPLERLRQNIPAIERAVEGYDAVGKVPQAVLNEVVGAPPLAPSGPNREQVEALKRDGDSGWSVHYNQAIDDVLDLFTAGAATPQQAGEGS